MLVSLRPTRRRLWRALAYIALLAAAGLSFSLVLFFGDVQQTPHPPTPDFHPRTAAPETLLHLLLALIAVLVTLSALGVVCRRLRQPPVIGEIVAGLCLGPSVLGALAPRLQHFVLPADVMPELGMLSQVGVILFMFLVGLELDTGAMRREGQSTLAISHASIILPFVLGSTAAIWLFPKLAAPTASFPVFALFLGVSLSVTAFPVLARILTDNDMQRSPIGLLALTCAAVDDVTAWCLLALVVGVAKSSVWEAVMTCAATGIYVAVVFVVVRPLVLRWVHAYERKGGPLSVRAIPVILLALLVSSLITEAIGIRAIFGAFLLGAVVPHDAHFAHALRERFHDLVVVLFLPAFFAFTGMRTEIALVSGWDQWSICGLIVLIACAGKFGGSYLAARCSGMDPRAAAAIGILMNTRGLMELIVLNLGLDLGVISPTLFAMMVVMALVTTFSTSPLLRMVHKVAPARDVAPLGLAVVRSRP